MINPRYKIGDPVLPDNRNPKFAVKIVETKSGPVLEHTDIFGVTQRRSMGELSRFMLAIMQKGRLIGAKCPKCNQILVPAFTWNCPNCGFVEMYEVCMPDIGVMVATPVISYFPPSDMSDQVPYAQGYVYLENGALKATTAMAVPLTTRTGVIRPGLFCKDMQVKIIFRPEEERIGQMTDVAAIPIKELTVPQIAKSPLLTTDIDWTIQDQPVFEVDSALEAVMSSTMSSLAAFAARLQKSERARKDLAGLDDVILFHTAGGNIILGVYNQGLHPEQDSEPTPNFTAAVKDPGFIARWIEGSESLINGLASSELWLDRKEAVPLLTALDRLHRSMRRDGV